MSEVFRKLLDLGAGPLGKQAIAAIEDDEITAALISLILATPGFVSDEFNAECHQKLLNKNLLRPAGHGGRFTWDGYDNAITKNALWPNSFTWIDYVLWVKHSSPQPIYMDSRVVRLASTVAFPELAEAMSRKCNVPKTKREKALELLNLCGLGVLCRHDASTEVCNYRNLIRRLKSSVGVGEELGEDELIGTEILQVLRYGMDSVVERLKAAVPARIARTASLEHAKRPLLEIIDPFTMPLFTESSDHYAVLSKIILAAPGSSSATPLPSSESASPLSASDDRFYMFKNVGGKWSSPAPSSVSEAKKAKMTALSKMASEEQEAILRGEAIPFPFPTVRGASASAFTKIRIMTQNLHFRPYKFYSTGGGCGTTNLATGEYEMPASRAENMQEFRARVFVHALEAMTAKEYPHFLCLQETQHESADRILTEGLKATRKFDVITSKDAHAHPERGELMFKFNVGLVMPVLWSGLQLWYSKDWEMKDSHFFRFTAQTVWLESVSAILRNVGFLTQKVEQLLESKPDSREHNIPKRPSPKPVSSAGADEYFVNKGVLWVLLEKKNSPGTLVQIIVTHPSPYVKLPYGLAGTTTADSVAQIHRKQINAVREFIRTLSSDDELFGVPLFVTGDLNINRYAVRPGEPEEADPVSAANGKSLEFSQVLKKLNAVMPKIVVDGNTSRWVPKNRLETAIEVEKIIQERKKARLASALTKAVQLKKAQTRAASH